MNKKLISDVKKPLLYLDQNVLGDPLETLIKADADRRFRDGVFLVFSDETMAEILRSNGLAEWFVRNLEVFETMRVYAEMDRFKPTGRYLARSERPSHRLREIAEEGLLASFDLQGLGLLHKFFGGQDDKDFSDIAEAQVAAMVENWDRNLETFGLEHPYSRLVGDLHKMLARTIAAALRDSAHQLNENLGKVDRNSVLDFRREMKVDPQALNKITGVNAVEQIWHLIQTASPQAARMELEQYFAISGENPFTKAPYTIPEKVRTMMLILNLLGFHADKKLRQIDRFTASMSDLSHASWGSLCTDIVSKDVGFRKRLRAVYDYLDVPTHIHDLDPTGQFVTQPS